MEAIELQEKTKEELLQLYEQTLVAQEELEATLSVLKDEFILRLKEENKKGDVVAGMAIQRIQKIIFKTTVEQARPFGAIRSETKEVVDTKILRSLHDQGVEIPGTTVSEYVMIKPLADQ